METKKPHTRRMPTEGPFMYYNTNDILYTLMYSLATYNPDEAKLYLTKRAVTENKKLIYNYCDFSNSAMMKRHLDKLKEKELITEKEDKYYFPQNPKEKYRIIEKEMLFYLATTRSCQAIRVYLILLDCFLWKKSTNDNFIFTNTYLLERLGYSISNKTASAAITNILESFRREGVIDYEENYKINVLANGIEVPSPVKTLKFVAEKKSELKN